MSRFLKSVVVLLLSMMCVVPLSCGGANIPAETGVPDERDAPVTSRLKFSDPGPPRGIVYRPLTLPERVEITVLNEKHEPQEGAAVKFSFQHDPDRTLSEIEGLSDSEGRIVLDFADIGQKTVRELEYQTTMPGYLDQRERRFSFHSHEDDFPVIPETMQFVLDPGKRHFGRVLDEDGNALAGVKALVRTLGGSYELTTDDDGFWQTPLLPTMASLSGLELRSPDHVPEQFNQAYDFRETVLKRGRKFGGTVVDTQGEPLPWATIRWRYMNEAYESVADDEGRFAIAGLAPRVHHFVFRAENAADSAWEIDLTAADHHADVTLVPGHELKIRVVDEDGNALPDAVIHCYELSRLSPYAQVTDLRAEGGPWIWHQVPEEPLQVAVYWRINDVWQKYSDDNWNQPESPWNNLRTLEIFAVSYRCDEKEFSFVPREEEYVVVMKRVDHEPEPPTELVLPEEMTLRIRDAKGNPVAGAEINATLTFMTGNSFPHPTVSQTARTDANGGCIIDFDRVNRKSVYGLSIDVKTDDDLMSILAHWSDSRLGDLRMHPDNRDPEIPAVWEIQLPRWESLAGKVVDENGKPLPGVQVGIESPDSMRFREQTSTPWFPVSWHHVTTDDKGEWRTDEFYLDSTRHEANPQKLIFSLPDYATVTLPAGDFAGQPVRLSPVEMRESKKLRIDIRDEEGDPVERVRIRCDERFAYERLATGEHVYTLDDPDADEIEIVVMTDRHTPQIRTVKLEDMETRVEFRMERGKRMRIRAVDQYGDPVPHISIENVWWQYGEHRRDWLHGAYLEFDENGVLDWNNAPDVEAEYTFRDPNYKYWPKNNQRTRTLQPRDEEYVIEFERRR